MATRFSGRVTMLPLPFLLLSGCAQGSLGVDPGTVLSTIIYAGSRIGTGSPSTSGGSRTTSRARVPASPAPSVVASRVLNTADQYLGTKYTWGGNTPQAGFDCSGFTKYVFAKQGIALPRTSREQSRAGQKIALDLGAMIPGDLMFFAEEGEGVSHVAIYAGNGQIIHSSSGYHGVNYLDLNTSAGDWYVQSLVAVRRLITSNGKSLVQPLKELAIPGWVDPPDRAPAR